MLCPAVPSALLSQEALGRNASGAHADARTSTRRSSILQWGELLSVGSVQQSAAQQLQHSTLQPQACLLTGIEALVGACANAQLGKPVNLPASKQFPEKTLLHGLYLPIVLPLQNMGGMVWQNPLRSP